MTTPLITTTTDEIIADLERLTGDSELTDERWISGFTAGDFRALLAERADLKQQLVAAGITADNCELFRKDAERMTWLEDNYGGHTGGSGGFHMHMYLHTEAETVRDMIDAAMRQ